jgi:predicted glycoside hydrolase/deacetylase ChbG (UPF0249 family)
MKIILNADDFGYDQDTVTATIECFERGALTSATIMPKMPATPQAVDFARKNPRFSFGVHLTYVTDTVEAPVCDPAEIRALLREDGLFLASNQTRIRALLGRLPVAQIMRETRAQIRHLLDCGIRVSHVDSHGHLHKFRPFRRALEGVLKEFGIVKVRGVQDIYLKKPLLSPTYWFGGPWRKKIARAFKTTDHFYMCTSANDSSWPVMLLERLPEAGTLELGVHPGYREQWRRQESEALQDFARRAVAKGHALINWAEL